MITFRFLFPLLFFVSSLVAATPKSAVLYDAYGNPSAALLEVLKTYGIEHDGCWETIVCETQKKWRIGSDKERWQIQGKEISDPETAFKLFSRLGMTQTDLPEKKSYCYAAIHGATVQVVRQRFWFLKQLWDGGLRFQKLVVLTGDRPLDPAIEDKSALTDPKKSAYPFRKNWSFEGPLPTNETGMTKLVFDQLALPQEWRALDVIFVDTPKPEGKRRPETVDTFCFFLKMCPQGGTFLAISSQPFTGRQDSIGRWLLPQTFEVETVGMGFDIEKLKKEKRALPILLDDLARWIYQEQVICP